MVTPEQLLELISSGERNDVEFKERLEGESVKKTIVAFANDWSRTGGGTLILGVAKNGRVVGIRETQDQALQLIANFSKDGSIDPKPSVDPHPVLYNGKLVLVVRVPAGRRPPYRYEGRTYIRVGSTTHIATIEQEEILRERSLLPEDQRSQPLVSLPPRESIVVDFVGRSEELSVLNNWLSDPWLRRCSIVGQGGCGKTALAYEFATKVAESRFPYSGKRIDCIVWLSAKRKRFYAGEVREVSPDFSDFESLLSAILTAAGFTEYAELPVNERAAQVLELLSAFPTLLIVDDLDTLLGRRDDPDVARAIEFVLDAIPKKERAKVLVTSRQAVLWAQAVYVKAFPKDSDEGLAFVESRMKLLELESLLGREQKREILRVTDGIPLYVEELLRLIKITANPRRAIQEWQQHGGRRAREFALARECEALGKEAQLF
ncbi:MAG: putative DNA binding domain-containing protein [Armatimonadota bacterium]|nr:putative DNA binding domain-containing protein [Armatimonadota bacterium]